MSEFKAINLLEEFHDYETASQVLNELEEGESIMTRHGLVSREVVAESVLNHRRENNIYEMDDIVVFINKRHSGKLWRWIHVTNWRPNHSLLDCGEDVLYPFSNDEFRHATHEEIAAGWREGSKEFDLFWYGQSLGEAIKAHELLGEELIEGGAAFIGNNSNIVQMVKDMGDDSHIENHISPNCKVEDV